MLIEPTAIPAVTHIFEDVLNPCEILDMMEESEIQDDRSQAVPDVRAAVVDAKEEYSRPESVTRRLPVVGELADDTGENLAQLIE